MRLFLLKHSKATFIVFFCFALLWASTSSSYAQIVQKSQDVLDTTALLKAGRIRDSLAAQEAIKTWWTASMRNHDKRIAWWRNDRFGCFIHWGVYSGPGGVWEDEPVHGYAEHLMRIKKIPLAEYKKEVVEKFDPVNFNADAWVKKIKYAGMRYLIITAKHHDGFAMFNSDVSSYNVVKATPWHHDPMKDLEIACKKYGIKFGFYYSHAFDWQDPNAPGNDWDYNNPGGDKHLFGGVKWYDLHPEMLTRIMKYANGKAPPQIRELIRKYHPDILWFDTPQKLPFSVNLYILQEIRKIDTTVVINGRLAKLGDKNFGDYKNTADRPKEYFPVQGNWEGIPTTNESYGYNQSDTFHKPASDFIHLLAKAASRGGNMLMNVGPMGNGFIDPKDTAILYGIGNWMKTNHESIYGTTKTPLPLQSWGVSTQKGNLIYLQVFRWPVNKQLVVGGLKSNLLKAWLLSDKMKKELPFKRLNDLDVLIQVPGKAPDTISAVIVLQCKMPIVSSPVRLLSSTDSNRLLAFDSKLHGKGLVYGDGKADRYYVYKWTQKNQSMSWEFRLNAPTTFDVHIKYATNKDNKGSIYQLSVAGKTLKGQVQFNVSSAKGNDIYTDDIGRVTIPRRSA